MNRFRSNRWFNTYTIRFESSDELGLKLRSSIGSGIDRYLKQSEKWELSLIGDLLGTS